MIVTGLILALLASGPVEPDNHATLVSEVKSVQPGHTFRVAVYLQPSAGWHTYWSNPGDSGSPTDVKLKLPKGWKAGPVIWPTPEVIDLSGIVSYGYNNAEFLLMDLTPPAQLRPGSSVHLGGKVNWLTCTSEVCKPAKGDLALSLPVSRSSPTWDSKWHSRFVEAIQAAPKRAKGWTATASLDRDNITLRVTGSNLSSAGQGEPYVFPEDLGVLDHSGRQSFRLGRNAFTAVLPYSKYAQHRPDRLRAVLKAPSGSSWTGLGTAVKIDIPISKSQEKNHG